MGKLIAIGGGQIGRPGFPIETSYIDREIIKLSGKKHPQFLFIPTASHDSELYIQTVKKYFGKKLGCRVNTLCLWDKKLAKAELKKLILETDIIYVGGGNTQEMLRLWKQNGVDKLLFQAFQKNIVISGLSAGAICWFRYGLSDSLRFGSNKKFEYIRVSGLALFPFTISPHHIREKSRRPELIKLMKTTPGIGLAMDDYSALEIIDDRYRVIRSKPGAKIQKVYYSNKKLFYKPLPSSAKFTLLTDLKTKKA